MLVYNLKDPKNHCAAMADTGKADSLIYCKRSTHGRSSSQKFIPCVGVTFKFRKMDDLVLQLVACGGQMYHWVFAV